MGRPALGRRGPTLSFVRDEAARQGECHVETEHQRLALIRKGDGCGGRVLRELGADRDRERWKIQEMQKSG